MAEKEIGLKSPIMFERSAIPSGLDSYLDGITITPPLPAVPVVPVLPSVVPPMTTVRPVMLLVAPEELELELELPEAMLLVTVTLLTFVNVCVMVEVFTKPGTSIGGAWVSIAVDVLSKGNVNEPDVIEVLGMPGVT